MSVLIAVHCSSAYSSLTRFVQSVSSAADQFRHTDLLHLLLETPMDTQTNSQLSWLDLPGATALHIAALNRQVKAIEALIMYGAEIEAECERRQTPLHYAAAIGSVDCAVSLLEHGAKKRALNTHLQTPLMIACLNGRKDVLPLLLESEIDSTMVDIDSNSALHLTAQAGSSVGIFIELLQREWDPFAKNFDGKSPLDWALSHPRLATYIYASGLDLDAQDRMSSVRGFLEQRPDNKSLTMFCRRYRNDVREFFFDPTTKNPEFFLCEAAAERSYQILSILLDAIEVDSETEREVLIGHIQKALTVAFQASHVSIFAFMVRRMGSINTVHNAEGINSRCMAKTDHPIIHWLLVGKYVDQMKMTNDVTGTNMGKTCVKPWSGVRQVQVPLVESFGRRKGYSLLKTAIYWHRRRHQWQRLVPLNWDPVAHFTPTIEEIRAGSS